MVAFALGLIATTAALLFFKTKPGDKQIVATNTQHDDNDALKREQSEEVITVILPTINNDK